MNTEQGIYSILTSDSTLMAMLATTTSVFQEIAAETMARPLIVYTETTGEFSDTKDGVSTLDVPMVQVDVYANDITERNIIGARVRTILDGYRGTADGIVFDHIRLTYSLKLYDDIAKCYRQTMDFQTRQKV